MNEAKIQAKHRLKWRDPCKTSTPNGRRGPTKKACKELNKQKKIPHY